MQCTFAGESSALTSSNVKISSLSSILRALVDGENFGGSLCVFPVRLHSL